jgi:hemerythrin-like metal-binding protein
MHRFEFKSELETGNPDIDSQHQTLFAMANEVLYSRELEQSPERFHLGVSLFVSYLEDHFAAEELAMLEQGYAIRRSHIRFHDYIRQEARAIVARLSNGKAFKEIKSSVYILLEAWILFHVRHADCHFAAFLREQFPRAARIENIDQTFVDRLNVILQKQGMVRDVEGEFGLYDCETQAMVAVVKDQLEILRQNTPRQLQLRAG